MCFDLPVCCCFRLIYIVSDRKIVCFGEGLDTLPRVNGDFAGDRRVERQADRRVPHSTGTSGQHPQRLLGIVETILVSFGYYFIKT